MAYQEKLPFVKDSETESFSESSRLVLTIGHSTHPLDDFIRILEAHGVRKLVDVRTVPRSRHNPQFNRDTLPDDLTAAGIGYLHMPGLGGFRHSRPDSRIRLRLEQISLRSSYCRNDGTSCETSTLSSLLPQRPPFRSNQSCTKNCKRLAKKWTNMGWDLRFPIFLNLKIIFDGLVKSRLTGENRCPENF